MPPRNFDAEVGSSFFISAEFILPYSVQANLRAIPAFARVSAL